MPGKYSSTILDLHRLQYGMVGDLFAAKSRVLVRVGSRAPFFSQTASIPSVLLNKLKRPCS